MAPQQKIRLCEAAKFYRAEPHQDAAWNLLESKIPAATLAEFAEIYRAAPAAKPTENSNSWEGVFSYAKDFGAKFPELVAAQWALESDHGKAVSGRHNYFGLKGPGTTKKTEEVVNGKRITIEASFLDFRSVRECVGYLVDRWHRDWKGHLGVNRAANRDEAARLLVSEGYATDPQYAEKLIKLMGQHAPQKAPVPLQQRPNPLPVRYLSQRDSTAPGQAMRMCFSSSCAMLCAFLRPGSITGANADDQYLATVRQFGDTTDANAQLRALAAYGIKARFVQTADWGDIERQIDRGVPVPCGFLHHGPVSKPSGGGHWLTVVGYTPSHVIVHDPFGEMDVVAGTYLNTKGAMVSYSRKNWGPRWMPEGSRSGWAIIAEP